MVPYLVFVAGSTLADLPPPDVRPTKATWAFAIGVAIDAVSFALGVATIGFDYPGGDQAKAGWIGCSAGFAVAPFVAHAIQGEWLRGLAFSAVPVAGVVGNALVLAQPQIDHIDLNPDQRLIYAFTTAGLLGSMIGLLDVVLFEPKTPRLRVAPTMSRGGAGVVLGGSF